jgi:hypothetical protein
MILLVVLNMCFHIYKKTVIFKVQEQQEEAAQAMSTISQESNFTGKKKLNIF